MDSDGLILRGKRIAFVGKLGAMTRKEAAAMLRDRGASPLDRMSSEVDLVVIGADQLPDEDVSELIGPNIRARIRDGLTTLVHEHELWQQLGLVDDGANKQLYTPAMMAGLLKTPVRNVRRWHRMGLLSASKIAHRLPYFDFEQVQNARQLAAWIGRGARPNDIKKQLVGFSPWVAKRSLIDLDLLVDGRRLLLRQGDKLLDAHGQLHLDFEGLDEPDSTDHAAASVVPLSNVVELDEVKTPELIGNELQHWTRDQMLQTAEELDDAGNLEQAIEWYRVILARYGLSAEICFQLAELLYRSGDISAARERYYNAVELDEDFLEARANLGCVLAETGQVGLAIAAFQGALSKDDSCPDVHYHLARCLDETGESDQAARHWLRFLQLSPQSPWADEALDRLGRL
jgi:tetratricopeptide (TPR) repeat protein